MGSGFVIAPAPKAQTVAVDALAPFRAQLEDPLVTDIFINGARGMFVDRGSGTQAVPEWTASEREVRELASELIAQGGRHVDDAHPCVDVRLRGGIRVHAVLAPIATAGTTLSIRIPRFAASSLATLAEQGMMDGRVETVLRQAVARRANLLVSGAAGVGKTTLLSALLGEAPPTERIVTIEDVAEITLDHPHHVALESRQANLEGAGEVGLARLVREALRMKPDRLVIGECHGAEVRELLSALNTGHDGGAGTVHANSLADVATRLEALGALAGLDETTLARQVTSAIEFVIHLERDGDGRRRVAAVGEFRIVEGRLFVVPKDIPLPAATAPTRRSRRRGLTARGAGVPETEATDTKSEAPSDAEATHGVGRPAGADHRAGVVARAGAASAAGARSLSSSALSSRAASSSSSVVAADGFLPTRAAHPAGASAPSPAPAGTDGDEPMRGATARSVFTPGGDWHRVAAVRRGADPTGEAPADRAVIRRPRAGDLPRRKRERASRADADTRSESSDVRGGVVPTFDEWRERLSMSHPPTGAEAHLDGRAGPHRPPLDDDRWSEESMRAQRAAGESTSLTDAELDAQWDRLVAGWETVARNPGTSAPGSLGAGSAPARRGSAQETWPNDAAVAETSANDAVARETRTTARDVAPSTDAPEPLTVRGRRGGGAWTFVPETVPPGQGVPAHSTTEPRETRPVRDVVSGRMPREAL